MKKPICPHCGRKVLKVIGTFYLGDPLYYIEQQRFGRMKAWGPAFDRRSKKNVQSFYCSFCYKTFPEKMKKEIWKYLKYRKLMMRLETRRD